MIVGRTLLRTTEIIVTVKSVVPIGTICYEVEIAGMFQCQILSSKYMIHIELIVGEFN